MDKPIPEAVVDRLAHEVYQVHCDTPIRAFPNDSHWPKWRAVVQHVADHFTAAQQQGDGEDTDAVYIEELAAMYDPSSDVPEVRELQQKLSRIARRLRTAPPSAPVGVEDWRETERRRLLQLRTLLEGFEVEIEAEPLESPATYLDKVSVVGRFQPAAGGAIAAKRIAAILACPPRDPPALAQQPAACTACNGRGEVGGATPEGFETHPCPECEQQPAAMDEACAHCVDGTVPMTFDRPCSHCHGTGIATQHQEPTT